MKNRPDRLAIDPTMLQSKFAQLRAALAVQHGRFTHGADDNVDLDVVGRSLAAVNDFLMLATPDGPDLLQPLLTLGLALGSVQNGRVSPLLKPRTKRHVRHRPAEHEVNWATGAACITLLLETGMSLTAASRMVQKEFELRNVPLPGRKDEGSAGGQKRERQLRLKDYRDRLLQGDSAHDDMRTVYTNACEHARKYCGSHAATALLEILRNDLIGRKS
jgi:hypothetical protein